MKQMSFMALIGCSVLLAGCTSQDEVVFCPTISAPEEGARAFVRSEDAKQVFDVRLNGVNAICTPHNSGGTMVALSVGLKIKRFLPEGAENDVVVVPMMSAIVDVNQTVMSNQGFDYRFGFDKGSDSKFPVAEVEQLVPAEARLVISLRPAY
ncbi:hypothetical protein OAD74_08245 [Alphaproteobacteria bacterium]|nr:hypothetical protein [Alphaproteobacteria bacterium]